MKTGTERNDGALWGEAKERAEQALGRIRDHPFVLAAYQQTLTQEQAERWIFCAGRESRSFPAILENLVSGSSNDRIRAILQANLDDEFGNGNPDDAHFRHYLHLLDELRIPRERFYGYRERAGIQLALSLAYNVSLSGNEALAIGYMVVNEGMTPITYAAAYRALGRYHPAMNTPFFDLHVAVDERHVNELYEAIAELPGHVLADLLFGISVGERGMAVLLDEALGLFDSCETIPAYEPAA